VRSIKSATVLGDRGISSKELKQKLLGEKLNFIE
jgi:hypothetical protein